MAKLNETQRIEKAIKKMESVYHEMSSLYLETGNRVIEESKNNIGFAILEARKVIAPDPSFTLPPP